jgi:hypothetical protein
VELDTELHQNTVYFFLILQFVLYKQRIEVRTGDGAAAFFLTGAGAVSNDAATQH